MPCPAACHQLDISKEQLQLVKDLITCTRREVGDARDWKHAFALLSLVLQRPSSACAYLVQCLALRLRN